MQKLIKTGYKVFSNALVHIIRSFQKRKISLIKTTKKTPKSKEVIIYLSILALPTVQYFIGLNPPYLVTFPKNTIFIIGPNSGSIQIKQYNN